MRQPYVACEVARECSEARRGQRAVGARHKAGRQLAQGYVAEEHGLQSALHTLRELSKLVSVLLFFAVAPCGGDMQHRTRRSAC